MLNTPASKADGFEPPKYLASLIAAINDGAKSAQGGMLLYLLVGLYLLATAFSSTDEDLLLGKTVTIAQIGASLPVSFSFAIAPLVFVILHVYTLTRFDMLAANVRHFMRELATSVPLESDRERCRQLLANVEFILALAMDRGAALGSWVWRWMVRALLAGFPVVMLLLVQVNALRYQSLPILWAQRAWLLADLAALMWFFHRNPLVEIVPRSGRTRARIARWSGLLWLPIAVCALNLLYMNVVPDMNVVPAEADARLIRYRAQENQDRRFLADAVAQPLDVVFYPAFRWGCRYLSVERRTLVQHVWDDKVMVALRDEHPDYARLLPGIEGVNLIGRSLRFAELTLSRLYRADMAGADLRMADLSVVAMPGATLAGAQLAGADLTLAQLAGANLISARLVGADLTTAQLAGADLTDAQLAGANLTAAQLAGADLTKAQLAGAYLLAAQLAGANLTEAQLAGADLSYALLLGASLAKAQLAGANLTGAALIGADLRSAHAWGLTVDRFFLVGLADLRDIRFGPRPDEKEKAKLRTLVAAIPEPQRRTDADGRLSQVLGTTSADAPRNFRASRDERALVSRKSDPPWSAHPDWFIEQPDDVYRAALASFLAGRLVARQGPAAAANVVQRGEGYSEGEKGDRETGLAIACKLRGEVEARRVTLERRSRERWRKWLRRLEYEKQTCPAASELSSVP
jgi:uncharacterized protein YjbI with pentapeptide repeats